MIIKINEHNDNKFAINMIKARKIASTIHWLKDSKITLDFYWVEAVLFDFVKVILNSAKLKWKTIEFINTKVSVKNKIDMVTSENKKAA